jgi:hypothetical protein
MKYLEAKQANVGIFIKVNMFNFNLDIDITNCSKHNTLEGQEKDKYSTSQEMYT